MNKTLEAICWLSDNIIGFNSAQIKGIQRVYEASEEIIERELDELIKAGLVELVIYSDDVKSYRLTKLAKSIHESEVLSNER